MVNASYNHEMFVKTLEQREMQAQFAVGRVKDVLIELQEPDVDQFHIDHAGEHLDWAVKALREAADALASLRTYAKY